MDYKSTITISLKQLFLPLLVISSIYAASAQFLTQRTISAAVFELEPVQKFIRSATFANVYIEKESSDSNYPSSKQPTKGRLENGSALGVESYQQEVTSNSSLSAITAGPGGPILVISGTSNSFSKYPAEILLAEGLNEFMSADITVVSAEVLSSYEVVIVGNIPLNDQQVTMLDSWVNSGGTLIALKPDAKLAPLLGLVPAGGTLSNKYLLVNTSSGPGKGIVNQTIQYQGTADYYTLNGASTVAMLYSDASTATTYPAVTMRSVGEQGGTAVAFTYDLARSVVYTRQGNPAWSGQKRDGQSGPIRSDDQFYPDWIDLSKVTIPQADEQQRLLANIITLRSRKPVPRFWYLPRGLKAAVVMTGDDHGNGGTKARFNQYLQLSADNSADAVANWRAIRGTSYIYPNTPITDAEAKAFEQQGFEVALHLTTNCANFTPTSLERDLTEQLAAFASRYPSVAAPSTNRTHCIAWSDWNTQPKLEAPKGIRLDANYYYWPSNWVQNRPGMFTGSGIPMRFTDLSGSLIDCYQLTTQMTDESDQAFPYTIDQLLNKALGAEGYYGVFCANMHTDADFSNGSDAIIASARSRNVPVISSKQLLTWLDGRNGSYFSNMSWNGSQLNFGVSVASGALNLEGMLPMTEVTGRLVNLTVNGASVAFRTELIKGIEYAFFRVANGNYIATYDPEAERNKVPVVAISSPSNGSTFTAPASITVNATASDTDGTVTKVEFFNGDVRLEEDTSSPYSFTWNNVPPGSYTLTAKATDNAGAVTSSEAVIMNVSAVCPCTVFGPTEAPTNTLYNNGEGIQLGMRFQSSINGYVSGVRFYKQNGNNGTHTGQLYSNTGTLLAQAVFVNESASGWQEVAFSTPVAVTAGIPYVISYHSSEGFYSGTNSYFTQDINRSPLTGTANGVDGANGVYASSSRPVFPNSSYQSSNYWVDVVFNKTPPPANSAPVVAINSPAGNTGFSAPASIVINATASDSDGSIDKVEFYGGGTKLGEDLTSPYEFNWTNVTAGTYSLTARAIDNLGAATNSEAVMVNVSAVCPCSVFQPSDAPVNELFNDNQPIQLGMKFRSSVNGSVTGVRFYKQSGNTGTHIGQLYNSTGSLLAQGTFANETASGWQEVAFSGPVAITAGTTYVISYHSTDGHYSASNSYFDQAINTPPLSALAHEEQGANGVYLYGLGYPTESSLGANYWVDVVFNTETEPTNQPPVVSTAIPDQSATIGTAFSYAFATGTFTDPDGDPLSYTASLTDNAALPAWLTFNGATRTFSGTAPANSPASLVIKVTASDGRGGTVSDEFVLTIRQPVNQSPMVSIMSPVNNATFTALATVNISASASDADGTVSKVEFFNGTNKLGEDANGSDGWSYSWANVASGTYALTARATDNAEAATTSAVVNVIVSEPVPVLLAPSNLTAQIVSSSQNNVRWQDNSPDEDGFVLERATKADFTGGLTLINLAANTTSYIDPIQNSKKGGGVVYYRVKAVRGSTSSDYSNVASPTSTVNQSPMVSITSPVNNATFTALATVNISASASDADGTVSKVEFFNGTNKLGEDANGSDGWSYSWANVASGTYALTARASDNAGAATTSAVVNITVSASTDNGSGNTAPTVSINSPTENATFTAPASITISATASETDGAVTKVEFFQGTIKLGEVLASPYSLTWGNVAAGTYSLTANATDNKGAVTTSAAVNVTVTSPPPAPTITNLSPTEGPVGTVVIISGTNLSGATSVTFGSSAATFQVNSSTELKATVPSVGGKLPQSVSVTVTTPGGSASASQGFTVTSRKAATSASALQVAEPQEQERLLVYPNPFSGKAIVSFTLEQEGEYTVSLYDAKGALVAVLEQGHTTSGDRRSVEVDGAQLAKGLYLVRLQTNTGASIVRLVLDK